MLRDVIIKNNENEKKIQGIIQLEDKIPLLESIKFMTINFEAIRE